MVGIFFKRTFDIAFSIIVILALAPFWIIIPILIKIDSPGRIFFIQQRVGKDSELFNMYKFRSMKEGTVDLPAEKMQDHKSQYTRIGGLLRRFSLDELPQLFNILKGDMSVVGPRPSHLGQTDQIALRKKLGTDRVKPGLTGLAQVSGRDAITVEEKSEYDKRYVFEHRPFMDLVIILKTIPVVLSFKGGN